MSDVDLVAENENRRSSEGDCLRERASVMLYDIQSEQVQAACGRVDRSV